MLYSWVLKLIENYSFVTRVERKNGYVFIFYDLNYFKNEKFIYEKYHKISYRANKKQLLSVIDKIKKEVGFEKGRIVRFKKILEEVKNEEKSSIVICS